MKCRIVLTTGLLSLAALFSAAIVLWAAPQFRTLIFEAEDVQKLSGKTFKVMKCIEDPSGKVSGKKVLAVPKLQPGEKVVKDEVTYRVRIPETGTYYFWARTFWSSGCGNSFYLKVEGYNAGEWVIGGDGTYDSLHWVCLSDGGDNNRPRPLQLKKGVVTFTLGAKESGARADQFLLTTDRQKEPQDIYHPTPDLLVIDKK